MITPKLLLCADAVVRDAQTNHISVFNIYEEFSPAGLPAIVPRLTVLAVLERLQDDPANVDARLRITLGERNLFERPVHIDFQGSLLARAIMSFEGFVLPAPGELHFSFAVGDAEIESYTLRIKAPPPHPVPQPQAQ
ncbi:MAG: hypothetical protein HYY49_06275 [Ignavibacteriales bacterium]|nr:hypothetical protein [Ignavibacteriales bacterium]